MTFLEQLEKRYPLRVEQPADAKKIRTGVFYVYILTIDEQPIIVGHGKRNRARVIFDSETSITPSHIKALTVRLHLLFAHDGAVYRRYLIQCASKEKAQEIEAELHREFRGNTLRLPEAVQENLLRDFAEDSLARMVIRMALCSSFEGITDLNRWRREGILGDSVWGQITERLRHSLSTFDLYSQVDDYETANAFVKMLIDQVILNNIRLNQLEMLHVSKLDGKHSTEEGIYWDKRLSSAQRRFLKACESLAKVKKLLSEADLRDQKGKLIEMSDLMAGEAKVPNGPM